MTPIKLLQTSKCISLLKKLSGISFLQERPRSCLGDAEYNPFGGRVLDASPQGIQVPGDGSPDPGGGKQGELPVSLVTLTSPLPSASLCWPATFSSTSVPHGVGAGVAMPLALAADAASSPRTSNFWSRAMVGYLSLAGDPSAAHGPWH